MWKSNFIRKNQIPDSFKEKSDLILGPFETKNSIGLIGLDSEKLYLISLDFSSMIKYSISIQLPFFLSHMDKLKKNTIKDLIKKYKTIDIKLTDLSDIQVKKSNSWKNYINVEYNNKTIKWNILERHETERYEKIFNRLKKSTFANTL